MLLILVSHDTAGMTTENVTGSETLQDGCRAGLPSRRAKRARLTAFASL